MTKEQGIVKQHSLPNLALNRSLLSWYSQIYFAYSFTIHFVACQISLCTNDTCFGSYIHVVQCKAYKLCIGWESFGVVRFDLGLLLQGQMRIAKLESAITRLLLVLEVCDCTGTYRKSWAGNLLVWMDLTLGPLLLVIRGWPNLKVLITHLLLVLEVWDGKLTYRKSWAGNLLVWSHLTLGPSFKVK